MKRFVRLRSRVVCATALGVIMGATATVFGLTDRLVMRPIRTANAERLVALWGVTDEPTLGGALRWWGQAAALQDLGSAVSRDVVMGNTGKEAWTTVAVASPSFLAVVGCHAIAGSLSSVNSVPGGAVVLSESLWRSGLAGAPISQQSIMINGHMFPVVAVVDSECTLPRSASLWIGDQAGLEAIIPRSGSPLYLGLLRIGANAEQLSDQLKILLLEANRIASPQTGVYYGDLIGANGIVDVLSQRYKPTMTALACGAALMSVAAVINSILFFLCFYDTRRGELATRRALGASTPGLLLGAFWEASAVAVFAAAAAIVMSACLGSLASLAAAGFQLPRLDATSLIWVSGALASAAAFLCGFVSAFVAICLITRQISTSSLLDDRSGSSGGRWITVLRRGFLTLEVAAAVVLCLGAVLSVQSVRNLQSVELGYDTEQVSRIRFSLNPQAPVEAGRVAPLQQELLRKVSTIPRVSSVAIMSSHPVSTGSGTQRQVTVAGKAFLVSVTQVAGDFMNASGLRLLAGAPTRSLGSHQVMVNSTFANVLGIVAGQQIVLQLAGHGSDLTVVGIVGDATAAETGVRGQSTLYVPYEGSRFPLRAMARTDLVVRCSAPGCRSQTGALLEAVEQTGGAAFQFEEIAGVISELWAPARLRAALWSIYAVVGAGVAVVGMALLAAYVVQLSRRDLAVRVALGARAVDLFLGVGAEFLAAAATGAIAGGIAFLALQRVLSGLLVGVNSVTGPVFFLTCLGLFCAAAASIVVPVFGLTKVLPSELLKNSK